MRSFHLEYPHIGLLLLIMMGSFNDAWTQPAPGDIYREYIWLPDMVRESEKFLRVGGRLDYQIAEEHMPADFHEDGFLRWTQEIDLEDAIRAEMVIELVQSHEDTKGLSVEVNEGTSIPVPDLTSLPQPQSAYMLHTYPVVPIPLKDIHPDRGNRFRLTVDSIQAWNWPQNLIYGVMLRIYYASSKSAIQAWIASMPSIWTETMVNLQLETVDTAAIQQVDYFGLYSDFNWEGDGLYRQWHGHTHKGKWRNHLGTATEPPYLTNWKTDWLPDQPDPIRVMARVVGSDSIITLTEAAGPFSLERDFSVELCRPFHQPQNWVTRSDTFTAGFAVHGPIDEAESYQVAWRSWSPCYGRGLWINDYKIWDREEPCYGYAEHLLNIELPEHLQVGENIIRTVMTPLIHDKMVHGMEVQYPGVMVKVKYAINAQSSISIREGMYEGRSHYIITTPSAIYYLDQHGGGLSRMIDREGLDWIDFKVQPWNQYPQSAASAYRGIPNLVFGSDDSGAGHPGHDRCESKVLNDSTILVSSLSGQWQWQWIFRDTGAALEILNVDPDHPYWFLYEGVPGGRWQPDRQYFGTDTGGPRYESLDFYKGAKVFENWQWAYFGNKEIDRVLYVAQLEADRYSDTFSFLGNSEKGIESYDGMVVFGFGRDDGAKPRLQNPNTFYLGFIEQRVEHATEHNQIEKYMERLLAR